MKLFYLLVEISSIKIETIKSFEVFLSILIISFNIKIIFIVSLIDLDLPI